MIYALWHGGNGYGPSDLLDNLEQYDTLAEVRLALRERRDRGDYLRCDFPFVNRTPECVFTPCTDESSSFWVWRSATVEPDGTVLVPEYPDDVVSFGPRGGVRVTPWLRWELYR